MHIDTLLLFTLSLFNVEFRLLGNVKRDILFGRGSPFDARFVKVGIPREDLVCVCVCVCVCGWVGVFVCMYGGAALKNQKKNNFLKSRCFFIFHLAKIQEKSTLIASEPLLKTSTRVLSSREYFPKRIADTTSLHDITDNSTFSL
jgi:hypothetical protein